MSSSGVYVFSLSSILILAGLSFGGVMALIGFGGLLGMKLYRILGSRLPLRTGRSAYERRVYTWIAISGFLIWGSALCCSLHYAA